MFWFKKVISQLFMPIPLVVLLLLFCILMLRNRKLVRSVLAVAMVILVFLSSSVGSNLLTASLENQYKVNNKAISADCLVMVLGSGHDDAVPGGAVHKLSTTALARLTEGVRQYKLGKDCKLIVSGWGGSASKTPHAKIMAEAALQFGIPKERIITFPLAKDTIEEAQYFKWDVGNYPFRLVTSASHMPRSMAIFHSQGLRPQAAPTDFITRQGYWWQLDANNLLSSQRAIHEYVGRLWFKLKYKSD
nr:ElyC/SanA/YdcF family protein [Shewanella violacea]